MAMSHEQVSLQKVGMFICVICGETRGRKAHSKGNNQVEFSNGCFNRQQGIHQLTKQPIKWKHFHNAQRHCQVGHK